MEEREYNSFAEVLTALAELFDTELSASKVRLYFEALRDLSLEEVRHAGNLIARLSKFFPRPADFREYVEPDLETRASIAWSKVERAFWRAGIHRSVVFDDPVIHAVMDALGGWTRYCNLPEDRVVWWRKDFERLYRLYSPLVRSGRLIPPVVLHGLHAIDGSEVRPVFIGDRKTILEWTSRIRSSSVPSLGDGNSCSGGNIEKRAEAGI